MPSSSPKIFVGVDGSSGSNAALRWAVADATARGGEVTAVMAWTFLDQRPVRESSGFDPEYGPATADTALHGYVVDAVGEADAGKVRRLPVCDLPANALLTASKDADLLVVGSRGLGGFKRLMLGSVAHQVVTHSTCPVVVVPTSRDEEA